MKLAVLTPIPTPYRDPFWNAVARSPGMELHVFYCAGGKDDRPWNCSWSRDFHAETIRGMNLACWRGTGASCFWNPGIGALLRRRNYDAIVIGGYNHITMWAAANYARRKGIPLYMMSESFLRQPRSNWRRRLKQLPVRWLLSHCSGGFPTGKLAEEYLIHYGAAAETLTRIPNVPDVIALKQRADEARRDRRAWRRHHSLADRPTVLFVGRLIPKKRAGLLIRAFHKACRDGDAQLVIVGDGTQRDMLGKMVARLGLKQRVHFAGFVQPCHIPVWYAMSDLFVLPSSETWGVAVLEALAAGLPVIVTEQVGCHPDVVTEPTLGDVIPAADETALVAALRRRLANPTDPSAVYRAWAPIRDALRYDVLAKQFVHRVQCGANLRTVAEAA